MNEKNNLFYDGLFETISPDGDGIVFEEGDKKHLRSKTCNYDFNKKTGYMEMWGETLEDDIEFSPFGPFIADIEVTTICRGVKSSNISITHEDGTNTSYQENDIIQTEFGIMKVKDLVEGTIVSGKKIEKVRKISSHKPCPFCVPSGTKISLADLSEKNVEDICVGDKVASCVTNGLETKENEVLEVYTREYEGELVVIELDNGSVLKLTPNHRVYLFDLGWMRADEIQPQDMLYTYDSEYPEVVWRETIKDISKEHFRGTVYNFHCTPDENYFANGVLVHNCYKSNNSNGYNMPLSTFKEIIDKMPTCLTQVALGADAQCESNPEIWDMMKYARSKGIVPNITVADIADETADKLVEHCGAVAVSRYADKNICYDSIKKLTDRGMKQTNMHFMIHSNNFDDVLETLKDIKNDERLSKLNAVVFLSLKQKGRGVSYTPLSQEKFTKLVKTCMHEGIPFGFDSCSGYKFVDAVKNMPNSRSLIEMCEPCDSTIQSIYFSAKGDYYPCSFCEDNFEPINISEVRSVFELWQRQEVLDFRSRLLNNTDKNGVRCCPMFNV